MAQFFSCFACHKVMPMAATEEGKCPSCGSADGEIVSGDRVEEGLKAGALFNIDLKTRKPATKKR